MPVLPVKDGRITEAAQLPGHYGEEPMPERKRGSVVSMPGPLRAADTFDRIDLVGGEEPIDSFSGQRPQKADEPISAEVKA